MKRKDVYKIIDSERDYQDQLEEDRTEGLPHSVGDYVVMLQHYINDATKAWTLNPGDEMAIEVVRKIAGIAVHCMEDHGAKKREPK